jgi:CHAD domain-containing protein
MVALADSSSQNGQLLTIQAFAFASIQKHFHKSVKSENEVLADQDPESLHQMRVGMRRLRTVLTVFAPFLSLSAGLDRDITKISKSLGSVRDLDVLRLWLQNFVGDSALDEKESKQIEKALQRLNHRRQKQFKQMCITLRGNRYRQFAKEFQTWLKYPSFQSGAEWPIKLVLPDLLLPLINGLLLHPGWLVAIAPHQESTKPIDRWSPNSQIADAQVEIYFAEYGTILHDLRKQAKRVRYQTEFFTDFYDSPYHEQILEFRAIQDLLGQLQDSKVLSNFLEKEVGLEWKKVIPSLECYLQKQRLEQWQQWQLIQQKYLNPEFRKQLRTLILEPSW